MNPVLITFCDSCVFIIMKTNIFNQNPKNLLKEFIRESYYLVNITFTLLNFLLAGSSISSRLVEVATGGVTSPPGFSHTKNFDIDIFKSEAFP